MNNITLNWSAEDRLRIDKLIGLLEQVAVAAEAANVIERVTVDEPLDAPETPQEAPEPVEPEQTPPATENAQDGPQATEETAPAPTYTVEDVRAKAMDLMRAGKRAEAKAIVNEYAANITDLPADKCDEVMARLTALEG